MTEVIELEDDAIELEDAPVYPLMETELEALTRCEAVIARGVQTFIEVGEALAIIRDGKLYRADFTTFEHYCRNKWGIGDSRARQLIGASRVAREIQTVTNVTLSNEGQARAAAKATPADRPRVIDRATELAGAGPRTAKHITQAREEIARPDLPLEFAVIQRRYASRGHVLSAAWDGAVQRFVVRAEKEGSAGAVMPWPAVLDRLERLETEPQAPSPPPRPSGAISASAYDIQAQRDAGRLDRARNFIAALEYAAARTVLDGIEVSTLARDRLLSTIPAGRAITLALTPEDCAALLREARQFSSSELTKKLPTIGRTLVLLIEAIKQP